MQVLVTGGMGYIGSHTAVELLESGYDIVIVDDFSNSSPEAIENIKKITNKDFSFYKCDINSKDALSAVFSHEKIEAVIHFAAYKAVGESCRLPIKYYSNNISGTINLLDVMNEYGCKKIVFSSSATVYGEPEENPMTEDFPLHPFNPYGTTKYIIEEILRDLYRADNEWGISILRYFNPIGAHHSGLIGERPNGIPNNIMPYICLVAKKKLEKLSVFGNDYPTRDGTGVRDYIHVVDLAKGHLKALEYIADKGICDSINLGTGCGYSVLELVNAFSRVNNVEVPYVITERRPGDLAEYYADPSKAEKVLGWKAELGIEDMVKSSWKFISNQQF